MSNTNKTYYNIFDYNELFSAKDDSLLYKRPFFESFERNVSPIVSVEQAGHLGVKRPFSFEQVDGIFIFSLLCFIFLIHIFKNGITFFKESFILIFTTRKNVSLFSETTITEFWYSFLLIFQTIFLSAVILYISFYEISVSSSPPLYSFLTIILFMLIILLFEGAKVLLYKYLGYLFDVQPAVSIEIRAYMVLIEMMGIIAFIPALLLIYSDYIHNILYIFFIFLFFVSRLIIFYRQIVFFLGKNVNILYLIVYLCTVEIIPYIILYKGLMYVYKIDVISLIWR